MEEQQCIHTKPKRRCNNSYFNRSTAVGLCEAVQPKKSSNNYSSLCRLPNRATML